MDAPVRMDSITGQAEFNLSATDVAAFCPSRHKKPELCKYRRLDGVIAHP